jgi:hypothetical protein
MHHGLAAQLRSAFRDLAVHHVVFLPPYSAAPGMAGGYWHTFTCKVVTDAAHCTALYIRQRLHTCCPVQHQYIAVCIHTSRADAISFSGTRLPTQPTLGCQRWVGNLRVLLRRRSHRALRLRTCYVCCFNGLNALHSCMSAHMCHMYQNIAAPCAHPDYCGT